MLLPGFGLEEWAQFNAERPETHLWHVAFYYVRDVPELLVTGLGARVFHLVGSDVQLVELGSGTSND